MLAVGTVAGIPGSGGLETAESAISISRNFAMLGSLPARPPGV